jgi:hypothetical protein
MAVLAAVWSSLSRDRFGDRAHFIFEADRGVAPIEVQWMLMAYGMGAT